jgi:hypothetical protein
MRLFFVLRSYKNDDELRGSSKDEENFLLDILYTNANFFDKRALVKRRIS